MRKYSEYNFIEELSLIKKASTDSILEYLISSCDPIFDDFVEAEDTSESINPWAYYSIVWSIKGDAFFKILLAIEFDFDNITDNYLSDVSSMIQEDSWGLDQINRYIKQQNSIVTKATLMNVDVLTTNSGDIKIDLLFDLGIDFGPSDRDIESYESQKD